ncbi:MAG: phosphoethanolamine transferase domain-containing protein, partial [Alphaproteobacteria bacterium]|nr:phosphoethanolamine transferase domain-containing protein [Alphaproteobacteria bacterium]
MTLSRFLVLMSVLNLVIFHIPFFNFVFKNMNINSFNGILLLFNLILTIFILYFFIFYLICYLSKYVGKFFIILFFILNASALYFVNTYSIIIDETMIGNMLNTNYEEASSFFSFKCILYIIVLGVLPSIYIFKTILHKESIKVFLITLFIAFVSIVFLIFINASNWLWIDKNSKQLGGLAMPWCYTINMSLFYAHQSQANEQEILLPKATIVDSNKTIVILVIGESARKQNFSLYGYHKNTNPLLSKISNVHHFDATSCATYTTAGIKCILEYKNTLALYEILPNYLYR